tara:strand:- start:428 stop:805 length:378 start_codon:yes stop_codon:yes gene_type:complete
MFKFKLFPRFGISAALVMTILWPFSVGLASDKFVSGFSDLPIMPDMNEIREANLSFDTAGGRIVVAFARTSRRHDEVLDFYEESLKQLGWKKKTDGRFFRDSEVLALDFFPDGHKLVVQFSLEPY